ncbi:MAG: T9SS type A sorting domain-containing protein [Bacteroidota bacterium]
MRKIYTRLVLCLLVGGIGSFQLIGQNGSLVAPVNPWDINETIESDEIRMQMHDITGLPIFIHDLFDHPIYDLRIYRIQYQTENYAGQTVTASGLVLMPNTVPCYSSIVAYCHRTVKDGAQPPYQDVPSQYNFSDPESNGYLNPEKVVAMSLASDGYIAVLPDYLGLGSADLTDEVQHLFLNKRTQAQATIDAIRATRSLCDQLGYPVPNEQLYISGFSQGAHAAMSTLEFVSKESLTQEFRFVHAGLSSGPYDLGGAQLDYLEQAANGSQALQAMRDYFESSCATTHPSSIEDCYVENTNADWTNVFPSVPVTMSYCTADVLFPGSNALVAKAQLRDNLPGYQFWEREGIQTVIAGAYQHNACMVPSMFAAKMGHDVRRVECDGERSTKSDNLSILRADEAGLKYNHFGAHYIVLDAKTVDFEIHRAEFLNIKGKLVKTIYDPIKIKKKIALDIRDLKEGVYAVRLHTNTANQYWLGIMKTTSDVLQNSDYESIVVETTDQHTFILNALKNPLYHIVFMDQDQEVMDIFSNKWLVGKHLTVNKEWFDIGVRQMELQTPAWSHTFYITPDGEGAGEGDGEGERVVEVDPNPVRGAQTVNVRGLVHDAQLIGLYDLNGQVLVEDYAPHYSGTSYQIDIPHLHNGVYLLKVILKNGQAEVSKVIINN